MSFKDVALAGEDIESLAAHYQSRLLAGFQRHLALCLEFYQAGRRGAWWENQIEDLRRGLTWCAQHVPALSARYRLNDFVLERI